MANQKKIRKNKQSTELNQYFKALQAYDNEIQHRKNIKK